MEFPFPGMVSSKEKQWGGGESRGGGVVMEVEQ